MGLFKSSEEKEKEKQEKEEKEFNKLLEKYNLKSLDQDDLQMLKRISSNMAGNGWAEVSLFFSGSNEDRMKINRLGCIQEQNWIIINQLVKLNNNIEKLINKKEK